MSEHGLGAGTALGVISGLGDEPDSGARSGPMDSAHRTPPLASGVTDTRLPIPGIPTKPANVELLSQSELPSR
jgi:hypothetical protein